MKSIVYNAMVMVVRLEMRQGRKAKSRESATTVHAGRRKVRNTRYHDSQYGEQVETVDLDFEVNDGDRLAGWASPADTHDG